MQSKLKDTLQLLCPDLTQSPDRNKKNELKLATFSKDVLTGSNTRQRVPKEYVMFEVWGKVLRIFTQIADDKLLPCFI